MWKLISESNSTSVKIQEKIYQALGLKQYYYLNELGEVKYENSLGESKILTIGDGLWVSKDGDILDDDAINEIKILGISQHIYRLVYTCFGGIIPKYYQIHHIDYDRNNNNIDNLLCITDKEHRAIHRPLSTAISTNNITADIEEEYNKYILAHNSYNELKQYLGKYNEYYYKWQLYLLEQINKYKELKRIERINKIAEQKLNTIKKQQEYIEQERNNKLNSGEYYINKKGGLSKKNKPKWTAERRAKTMATRNETVYNNPEWRAHVSEGTLKHSEQCSQGAKNRWNFNKNI